MCNFKLRKTGKDEISPVESPATSQLSQTVPELTIPKPPGTPAQEDDLGVDAQVCVDKQIFNFFTKAIHETLSKIKK